MKQKQQRMLQTLWSGTITSDSPTDTNGVTHTNWTICNGSNSTPDLRGRFIMSETYGQVNVAGEGQVDYNIGNTGGLQNVTLTIMEMPTHSHEYRYHNNSAGVSTQGNSERQTEGLSETDTLQAGGGQAHENRPPYYVLAYIMRIS